MAELYLPATLRWYETWASSPQASRFIATDWQRLHMLAPLVNAYWSEPDKGLLAEIRINEASLGATEADRLRLRWDVEVERLQDRPARTPAKPKATRRANVLRLVEGGEAS